MQQSGPCAHTFNRERQSLNHWNLIVALVGGDILNHPCSEVVGSIFSTEHACCFPRREAQPHAVTTRGTTFVSQMCELTHLLHACAVGHLVKGEVTFVHLEGERGSD